MADVRKTDLVTLSRHTLADQRLHPEASGDLTLLLMSIQLGCKFVASAVRKTSLVELTGLAGNENIQGEDQKKLDVLANEIFINSLRSSGRVCMMISEEIEDPIVVTDYPNAKYIVTFDPLDGSSNIDAGVNTGTIFGIFAKDECDVFDESWIGKKEVPECLKSGTGLVAAGYCMYGPSTEMVITTGNGITGYTLDPTIGEFIMTREDIKLKPKGKIYSVNEGNSFYWYQPCQEYFASLKNGKYSARYVGSMVADIHRTVLYGGIFAYPADKKSAKGKLRILYECYPMAMIIEQAGGKASTGTSRLLEVQSEHIHDRAPVFMGSKEDVELVEEFYKKFPVE